VHYVDHDSIEIQSVFYCNKVLKQTDCVASNAYSQADSPGFFDFKVADFNVLNQVPIGPFADWRIPIESASSINPGLGLSGDIRVYIEFSGNNQTQIPSRLTAGTGRSQGHHRRGWGHHKQR
jgi:hypothetical protein